MGDLDHRHAAAITQGVQAVEIFAPDRKCLGITLAETRCFDGGPAIAAAGLGPDQRLKPVHTVNDGSTVAVLFVEQGIECFDYIGVAGREREMRDLQHAKAVLGHDHDGGVGSGREGGFPDAVHAMHEDPGRAQRARRLQGGKRDSH